jgi:hypothetical protein
MAFGHLTRGGAMAYFPQAMATSAFFEARPDFSLVLGGPLFQLFRRAHLSGDALELLNRRVVIIACIAWVPLLILSLARGHAFGNAVRIPFLYDIEAQVRFLVALPILVIAELVVHRRLRPAVQQFVQRNIVTPEDIPGFNRAVESTLRLRNSVLIEVALIVIVYTVGIWVWRTEVALGAVSWYATPDGGRMHLTPAGYWYVFASVPIFQFLLLRWYFRFFLWFWLLFRISRLNLNLVPVHADRTGGLGFLGVSTNAFAPLLVAQGAILAGLIASQIFYAGRTLPEFKVSIVGFLAFFIIVILIPLMVFAPRLAEVRRKGLADMGQLASRYGIEFEQKWLYGDRSSAADAELLGSGDIQSLADLANSFTVVQEMRFLPFGWRDVTRLAVITAIPFFPLLLTVFSLEDFASYVIKAIF